MIERIGAAVAEELDLEEQGVALDAETVLRQPANAEAKPAARFRGDAGDRFGNRARMGAVAVLIASGNRAHDAADLFRLPIRGFAVDDIAFQRESGRRGRLRGLLLQVGIRVQDAIGGRRRG